ncbi:hypothetical protein [Azospirillum sp. SYSU D00513]|uniref:hypothetical protein n=1 Tax=Azospirillum sp. SYSU D00513 TaxID=2812561 RepID=UPI001FFE5953|nr:hypothetical protein [Azospirillum sp. SYSU D00513]
MEHGHGPGMMPATGDAGSGWLAWLQGSPLGVAMRESLWLYPAVEILHILGFVLLVGAVIGFDLRLAGWRGRGLPADGLARLLLPLSVAGFVLAVMSGLALFTVEATAYVRNPAFLAKLALVALALLNILAFHGGAGRRISCWGTDPSPPPAARLAGIASLLLWVAALAAGRLIAYM